MEVKNIMLKRETLFSKYASYEKDAYRLKPYKEDIRPTYFRDIDRIIHTKSYTRYMDKTQVYTGVFNNHITKRMVHVQLVSKIARTIGRALSLNEDLIEAIGLGHDLGHTPIGHIGEEILSEISIKNNEGPFMHNVQSVRLLMDIENVNLNVQVLDGILCHNGEWIIDKYQPISKTKDDFLNDYYSCYKDKSYGKKLVPMTLEGCVVRVSDVIAYLGRDIEDAITLKKLDPSTIPDEIASVIGRTNSEIINTIILDIIENSLNKPYIKISDDVFKAMDDLKSFNYTHIYNKANSKERIDEYKVMFNTLFDYNLNNLKTNNFDANIYKVFLNIMDDNYNKNTTNERKVIDYISGMTDDYFFNEYKECTV